MNAIATLAGRFGLAALFVLAGVGKLGAGYAGTQAYMEATGVPGVLLPLVIFAEIGGGLAIAAGLLTRWAAAGLALFSVASAFLFHFQLADPAQFVSFWKNVSIAGGLLFVVAHGAGPLSLDAWLARRTGPALPAAAGAR
jgi:putative oxidoreductase